MQFAFRLSITEERLYHLTKKKINDPLPRGIALCINEGL